jgi:poly(3-hydroxybutyrate) depolymerase
MPDDGVPYYNISCCYSRKKDAKKAVDWLKQSFDKGFLDLAHVAVDTDMDNIREDESFKELMKKTRLEILSKRPPTVKIVPKVSEEKMPLVVFLHADNTNVEELAKRLGPLSDALGCVLVIPSGRTVDAKGNAHWDSTAETCVQADVRAAVNEFDVDEEKIVIVGELDGAYRALKFGADHGWKHVVAAAGVYEKVEGKKGKDMRVWFFAPRVLDRALSAAAEARDDLLAQGGKVRIERHEGERAIPEDFVSALGRAVRWTLDMKDQAPDQGEIKKF